MRGQVDKKMSVGHRPIKNILRKFTFQLIVLGYLVIISGYVHKLVGICLLIAGAGWPTDSIQPLLFPNTDFSIGMITGTGELVFMLWLFIKGTRLKELDNRHSYNPAV